MFLPIGVSTSPVFPAVSKRPVEVVASVPSLQDVPFDPGPPRTTRQAVSPIQMLRGETLEFLGLEDSVVLPVWWPSHLMVDIHERTFPALLR